MTAGVLPSYSTRGVSGELCKACRGRIRMGDDVLVGQRRGRMPVYLHESCADKPVSGSTTTWRASLDTPDPVGLRAE